MNLLASHKEMVQCIVNLYESNLRYSTKRFTLMEENSFSRHENSCLIHEENGENSRPLASYFIVLSALFIIGSSVCRLLIKDYFIITV